MSLPLCVGKPETDMIVRRVLQARSAAGFFIGVAALTLRWSHVACTARSPSAVPVVDALTYHRQAAAISAGARPREPLSWQGGLYPVALALGYRLFGPHPEVGRRLHAVVGAGSAVLVYLLALKMLPFRMALGAGLLTAFYGPLIHFESQLLTEGGAIFSMLLGLSAIVGLPSEARSRRCLPRLVLGGLAIGAASLLRPPLALPLMPAIPLAVIRYEGWTPRERWVSVALIGASAIALLIPFAALNLAETGRFTALPLNGGMNLYLGNHPEWVRMVGARPGREWHALLRRPHEHGCHGPWERAHWYTREAVRYMVEDPARLVERMGQKLVRFTCSREIPRNTDLYAERPWSPLLKGLVWKWGSWGFPFGLLGPLAVVGWIRWRKAVHPVLWVVPLSYAVVLSLFFVTARYRVVIVPLLAIPAGAALGSMVQDVTARRWGRMLGWGCCIAGLAVASAYPPHFPEERDPVFFEAELYRLVGGVCLDDGRALEAEAWLRRALQTYPADADSHNDLAAALIAQGRLTEALVEAEEALRLAPEDPAYLANVRALRAAVQRARPGDR